MRKTFKASRHGSILPLFALMLVGLMGFVALAIDVGMIAIADTQAQNAADNAAVAGARTLNGTTSGNTTAATSSAQAAAAANPRFVAIDQHFAEWPCSTAYHYSYSSMTFTPQFPPVSPDNYNLTQATVTPSISSFFSKIFGLTSFNVQATRPRPRTGRATSSDRARFFRVR